MALHRSSRETILTIDPADKHVSFGNAARRSGVSVCRVHGLFVLRLPIRAPPPSPSVAGGRRVHVELRQLAFQNDNRYAQPRANPHDRNVASFCGLIRSIAPEAEILPTGFRHRQRFCLAFGSVPLHHFSFTRRGEGGRLIPCYTALTPVTLLSVSSSVK
jgi:hypothetical protein